MTLPGFLVKSIRRFVKIDGFAYRQFAASGFADSGVAQTLKRNVIMYGKRLGHFIAPAFVVRAPGPLGFQLVLHLLLQPRDRSQVAARG